MTCCGFAADQFVRILQRQRLKHKRIENTEERGIHAYAERERADRDEREGRLLP
jgi:hypothetical protein